MFGGGIRLPFRLLGIPLHLDWSFLLILPLLAWIIGTQIERFAEMVGLEVSEEMLAGATPWIIGLIAALGLFAGVVLHELGHAVTARLYGIRVRSITLWFLGGVARFDEMPRQPGAEAVVAIVGPLVSVALAILCWLALGTVPPDYPATRFVLAYLAYINVVIAVFNMLPALPLDGGRVLRSLLALAMPFGRATQISGWISRTFAIGLGVLGLLTLNFFLLLIAGFIYLAVSAETSTTRIEELLRGIPVDRLMSRRVSTVTDDTRIGELSELVWRERHTTFPVLDGKGHVQGMVTVADAQNRDPSLSVREVMRPAASIPREVDAVEAFRTMTRNGFGGVVVLDDDGRLAGIVTKTDIMRVMELRALSPDMPLPGGNGAPDGNGAPAGSPTRIAGG